MNPIQTMIDTATSSVEATTGFSFSEALSWGVDNLLKPLIGAGLGTLYVLRYWIIGLAVLSILVYFGFRGFGFWKH